MKVCFHRMTPYSQQVRVDNNRAGFLVFEPDSTFVTYHQHPQDVRGYEWVGEVCRGKSWVDMESAREAIRGFVNHRSMTNV